MIKLRTILAIISISCLAIAPISAHENEHVHGSKEKSQKMETKHHGEHSKTHKMHKAGIFSIRGPWIRSTAPGAPTTAAYFTLLNGTQEDIRLIDAKSDIAQRVEIHEHSMKDGVMKMSKVKNVLVPKQSSTIFKPGGYHVMFIGLDNPVAEGDKVSITLAFDNGTEQIIEAVAKKKMSGHGHAHHHDNY